jgi:hypothetical protein
MPGYQRNDSLNLKATFSDALAYQSIKVQGKSEFSANTQHRCVICENASDDSTQVTFATYTHQQSQQMSSEAFPLPRISN